jgi:excinuclease UvrABC nuclease subunit
MAAQTFAIEFDGYWRESKKSGIPSKSGIYCVYACAYDSEKNTVSIKRLIYIGESADVKDRIANHEKTSAWEKHLKSGEELCFSFGGVATTSRVRCEAAMVYKHKPPVNTEYVDSFPFDQTTISLSGETALLTKSFTVNRT